MPNVTETIDPRALTRLRHETRMRRLEVIAVTDITPKMRRISLRGDLTGFASPGHADHIKVFIFPAGIEPMLGTIGERGAEFPEGQKPQMRDYTPRFFDVAAGRIDIDFVLHGDGPASGWAAQAKVGQTLVIGGPRGSIMVPNTYDWYFLAGDETALPALGRRIEELPAGAKVVAVIEIADAAEEQVFESRADVSLHYVHRNGLPAGTQGPLLDAIKALTFPAGEAYAYVAAESGVAKGIKAHLLDERGFPPDYVRAPGYWLLGEADSH